MNNLKAINSMVLLFIFPLLFLFGILPWYIAFAYHIILFVTMAVVGFMFYSVYYLSVSEQEVFFEAAKKHFKKEKQQ